MAEDFWYVDVDNGDDTTGTGFTDAPFETIEHALHNCNGPGDGEDIIVVRDISIDRTFSSAAYGSLSN